MQERYSRQREAILSYLKSTKIHPSAETVYLQIKKDIPNISLGTVYRNLAWLRESGDIIQISMPEGAERYDGETRQHHHIMCTSCGRVDDIFEDLIPLLDYKAGVLSGYTSVGHNLHFNGLCPDCAGKS
ncbi:MAG: transcriptional repressor [Oscillospiraceae bacterium]|jgi:Fur family peroxide stress response transcriptional regulator|nr:transcriptional repressor [Oscillospiraceae bacterium]